MGRLFFFERQKFYKTKTSKELEITNYMREKAILGNYNQPTQSIVYLLLLFVAQKNERVTILSHKSPFLGKECLKSVSFLKDQIAHRAVCITASKQANSMIFKRKDENQQI